MIKIGVIILNWNNYYDTKKCIDSILKYKLSEEVNIQIYLIDNNSDDKSGEQLSAEFDKKVVYFNTGNNLGYTGGNNFGIKKAYENNCEFTLILNNDLVIENFDYLIKSMIAIYKSNSNIAIIGFDIFNYKTRNLLKSHGTADIFFNRLLNINTAKIVLKKDNILYSIQRTVCGCAIAFRKDKLKEIGLFDENFFMYAEEHDICLRAIVRGFKVARIHSENFKIYRNIDPISSNQLIWDYNPRNMITTYRKNLNGLRKIFFISYQIIIYIRQIIQFLFRGEFMISYKILKSTINGLFSK